MTQAEIGKQLGISQMHVSRLLTEALGYLRECLMQHT
jgi:RNA polymerase sigma-B factor